MAKKMCVLHLRKRDANDLVSTLEWALRVNDQNGGNRLSPREADNAEEIASNLRKFWGIEDW